MKNKLPIRILSFAAALFISTGLLAQEHVEVSVKVKKDGKVVTDTTYKFEDASEAKHAMKMMEGMSGEAKTMVFISEDGETTEIKEIHKDSLVWITEKETDGDHVKVMKYKIKEGEEPHGEHVIVMKSGDGNTFDILIDEDMEDGDIVKKKEVKVVVSDGEDIKWHVEGDEMIYDKDENVYIIKGDDEVKMKVMKIMEEEAEGEEMKVVVIKKVEELDHDEDHDVDHDHDEDHDVDHDEEVEVKVVKKKVKK
jgi:hypothetical protein